MTVKYPNQDQRSGHGYGHMQGNPSQGYGSMPAQKFENFGPQGGFTFSGPAYTPQGYTATAPIFYEPTGIFTLMRN